MLKIILCVLSLLFASNSYAIDKPKKKPWRYPVENLIHIVLPQQGNRNIYFEEIPLSQLRVLKGQEKINVEYRNFHGGPNVVKFKLEEEYTIKYKNVLISISKDKIYINNKVYLEHSISINREGKVLPGSGHMYFECHMDDLECQEANTPKK